MIRIKYRTDSEGSSIDTSRTMLQGTIQATLGQLIAAFGTPALGEDTDRVPCSWAIEFEGAVPATIYLWKQPTPAENVVTSWNIGGVTADVVQLVHEAFRQAHDLRARKAA